MCFMSSDCRVYKIKFYTWAFMKNDDFLTFVSLSQP
jgi:hypothetical protein